MTPSQSIISCEDNELMKFMLRRAKKSETPLCIAQMCEEFVDETGSKLSGGHYRARFMNMTRKIEKIRNYSIEDLAKFYFVTSLTPSDRFLTKLREIAIVEVDENNRIVKFKGQKVQFEGVHEIDQRVRKFNQYKAEKAKKNITVGECFTPSFDFLSTKPHANPFGIEYSPLAQGTETSPASSIIQRNLNAEENTRTISVEQSITPLSGTFSESLVIENQHIASIHSPILKDDSFENSQENCYAEKYQHCVESDMKMLKFLAKNSKRSKSPLVMSHLWGEYVKEVETERTHQSVQSRFQTHLAPRIHRMEEFDFNTKVLMLYASETPVSEEFLEQLKDHASVELDENNQIIKYRFKNDNASKHRSSHAYSDEKTVGGRKRSRKNSVDFTKKALLSNDQRQESQQKLSNSFDKIENRTPEKKFLHDNDNFQEVTLDRKKPKIPTFELDLTVMSSENKKVETYRVKKDDGELPFPVTNYIAPEDRNFVSYNPRNPPLTAYFGGPSYHVDSLAHYPQLSENFFARFCPRFVPASHGSGDPPSCGSQDNSQCKTIYVSEVCNHLKSMLLSLDASLFTELFERLEKIMEDSMKSSEVVPLPELHCILKFCLIKISRNRRTKVNSGEALKDSKTFLNAFSCLLLSLDASAFTDLDDQAKQMINHTESENQFIPISDFKEIIASLISPFSR